MESAITVFRLGAAWLILAGIPGYSQTAAGTPADWTDERKEEFLANAKVVKSRGIGVGINNTKRLTLSDGEVKHDAHHNTVDRRVARFESRKGVEFNFRDSYQFNVAAYKLDRLVGLNMIPVSVVRKIGRDKGSVTWWVDDVQMMELDRMKKKQAPPDPADWNDQMFQVRVFNELVYNTDPNLGNLLITDEWKIRLIDFTRAFRQQKTLRSPGNIMRIDRRVYDGLKALDETALKAELQPVLGIAEVRAILARRDRILELIDAKIAEKGEAGVICNKPGH